MRSSLDGDLVPDGPLRAVAITVVVPNTSVLVTRVWMPYVEGVIPIDRLENYNPENTYEAHTSSSLMRGSRGCAHHRVLTQSPPALDRQIVPRRAFRWSRSPSVQVIDEPGISTFRESRDKTGVQGDVVIQTSGSEAYLHAHGARRAGRLAMPQQKLPMARSRRG